MKKYIHIITRSTLAVSFIAISSTSVFAQSPENVFMNLNPYSELYLTCEELADEVAPVGLTTEHEDWKAVFQSCVKATLEIEPAAGDIEIMEDKSDQPQSLTIKDVDRDNTFTEDYGQYQNEMLGEDSAAE